MDKISATTRRLTHQKYERDPTKYWSRDPPLIADEPDWSSRPRITWLCYMKVMISRMTRCNEEPPQQISDGPIAPEQRRRRSFVARATALYIAVQLFGCLGREGIDGIIS